MFAKRRTALASAMLGFLLASCSDMKDFKKQMDDAMLDQQSWDITREDGNKHVIYAHQTTVDQALGFFGEPTVTAVRPNMTPLGGRVITFRGYHIDEHCTNGIGMDCILHRGTSITDLVLTFDNKNLLVLSQILDVSTNEVARQEVMAEDKKQPTPVASTPVKPLTDEEAIELQQLIFWRKLAKICAWPLPANRMAHLDKRITDLGDHVNQIDRNIWTNRSEYNALNGSQAACTNSGDKADFYKNMTRFKI